MPGYRAIATGVASTTTLTINKPTGTTVGDTLLAVIIGPTTAPSLPSGWTSKTATAPADQIAVQWKTADGSEGASFAWTVAAGALGFVMACTGASPSNPLPLAPTVGNQSGSGASGGFSTTSIGSGTSPAIGDLLVTVFCSGTTTNPNWTTPTGMTEVADFRNTSTGTRGMAVDYLVLTAAGATGAKSSTASNYSGSQVRIAIAVQASTTPTRLFLPF